MPVLAHRVSGLALVCSVCALSVLAGQQAPPSQPRSPLDATLYGVVYDIPATSRVVLHSDVPYGRDARGPLSLDIYLPPGMRPGETRPAVVFLNAIGDAPGQQRVRHWGIYRSWPRLVAAFGLVGIAMDADPDSVQESLRGVFSFLTRNGAAHGVDGSRLGVYAASANVSGASQLLLGDSTPPPNVKAAVLYYGRPPQERLRADLPVMFVMAEGDLPGAGPDLGALWQRVTEARAPWTLRFASRLPHAFDAFSDNDEARRLIQETIAFWKSNLEAVPQPPWAPSAERAIVAAMYDGANPGRLFELLGPWLASHPDDFEGWLSYARGLQRAQRWAEATSAFERAYALRPDNVGAQAGLGQTRIAQQRWAEAAELLSRAIAGGARNSLMFGQLGWAQLHLGQNEAAVRSYELAFDAGIPPGATTRGIAFYNLACGYARLGRLDQAVTALGRAITEGFANRSRMESDPDLAPVRADPRYQALLARLPAAPPP